MNINKLYIFGVLFVGIVIGAYYFSARHFTEANIDETHFSETEAGFDDISEEVGTSTNILQAPVTAISQFVSGRGRWAYYWMEFTPQEKQYYDNWKRPLGPARVGIQVGHWKNKDVPEELSGLTRNGSGASGGGTTEVVIVLQIAEKVKALLEKQGVIVELLPATVPVDYFADAFVSIHADGNNNSSVSGFKISAPQRDFSGASLSLVESLYDSYEKATKLSVDTNVTRRMSGYYAFNWRRYEHALFPLTPAAIVETGFLTSPTDRKVIVEKQDLAAKGIADGIIDFLKSRSLL